MSTRSFIIVLVFVVLLAGTDNYVQAQEGGSSSVSDILTNIGIDVDARALSPEFNPVITVNPNMSTTAALGLVNSSSPSASITTHSYSKVENKVLPFGIMLPGQTWQLPGTEVPNSLNGNSGGLVPCFMGIWDISRVQPVFGKIFQKKLKRITKTSGLSLENTNGWEKINGYEYYVDVVNGYESRFLKDSNQLVMADWKSIGVTPVTRGTDFSAINQNYLLVAKVGVKGKSNHDSQTVTRLAIGLACVIYTDETLLVSNAHLKNFSNAFGAGSSIARGGTEIGLGGLLSFAEAKAEIQAEPWAYLLCYVKLEKPAQLPILAGYMVSNGIKNGASQQEQQILPNGERHPALFQK